MDLPEPDLRAMSYARPMTLLRVLPLVLTLGLPLGACLTPGDSPGSGWHGGHANGCTADSECGGGACTRDGTCQSASNVHAIHVTWTVRGNPASDVTCVNAPDLDIEFTSNAQDDLGFAPVPCRQGKFTIDKLAVWYDIVALGLDRYGGKTAVIDRTTGNATIDLPY